MAKKKPQLKLIIGWSLKNCIRKKEALPASGCNNVPGKNETLQLKMGTAFLKEIFLFFTLGIPGCAYFPCYVQHLGAGTLHFACHLQHCLEVEPSVCMLCTAF